MKKYHLLHYVESCSPRIKKFKTIKALESFLEDFKEKYSANDSGEYWIDYVVTNITGELLIYDTYYTPLE